MTDQEIAKAAKLKPIIDVAKTIGLTEDDLELYGKYKAKLSYEALKRLENNNMGQLILVSAITPTPAGEGKTTNTIGLAQALNKIGKKAIAAIREPSLGPVFGVKGGAAGGGYSQVMPMEDINMHFTGDFHAITAANNTLAALIDNHVYYDNKMNIDPRRIMWKRVLDVNDRMLRDCIIGLGGSRQGFPREEGFDITPASEIMAILCLSNNIEELKERIGNIAVAFSYTGELLRVKDFKFEGAITAILKDALKPNLVQTLENTPVFVHGGPFANIAQGANSILATKTAMRLADFAVTEAGFGFDLGAEKFFDIVSRYGEFCTSAVVLVATVRAIKMHGGAKLKTITEPDPDAVRKGLDNLGKHLENIVKFGMKSVVSINRFITDTDEELQIIKDFCESKGFDAFVVDFWAKGGDGGLDLAQKVVDLIDNKVCEQKFLYDWKMPIKDKIEIIAKNIYGAEAVDYSPLAKQDLRLLKKFDLEHLPICMAKTQKSLSDNPDLLGRPKDFLVTVREIKLAAGAGFVIPITGEIMRMPGLSKTPSALNIDVSHDGDIVGLF
ncbi:MAG: formate--tetrahydrofolate ligase [Candidatus Cloacimonadales bacterium]|jgi:formate--tetrahydrofolate ligase|nr:formate--tetrahydrofolate ligase [Candidatus Cloacimonadota bacterium]MDX9977505.1 formate--tetrahydrofolate ligase [Candidatus Cloacimonadales bacterium]